MMKACRNIDGMTQDTECSSIRQLGMALCCKIYTEKSWLPAKLSQLTRFHNDCFGVYLRDSVGESDERAAKGIH